MVHREVEPSVRETNVKGQDEVTASEKKVCRE